jgi:ornithine cyclodeaminase/alanine dehydrogenase-like protein (mu-crystallin family)
MGTQYSEIPWELLERSRLYVDTREKFQHHWEPGTHPRVQAELGEVLVGRAEGRISEEDLTLFKPEGMAFEDVVSARIVVDRVRRRGSAPSVPW